MKVYWGLPRLVGRALVSADRPLLAHLVVTRRCNLSCGYCNEFDHVSSPVPFADLAERISDLARLKTTTVACSGGEPLLHPRIADVVREIRGRGMTATLTTNGYPLTRERIETLNAAGLQAIQISIDNLEPDAVSSKSLSVLEARLHLLAEVARFDVNINTVLGPGTRPTDAVEIARRATDYGFSHSVGLVHGPGGALQSLSDDVRSAYRQVGSRSLLHQFNYWLFQRSLVRGRRCRWKCRAGARFLYVSEQGLVHWCSQRQDRPGIPLSSYGVEDIRRAFQTKKACAPYCTINCAHHVSALDGWRRQDLRDAWTASPGSGNHFVNVPAPVSIRYQPRALRS